MRWLWLVGLAGVIAAAVVVGPRVLEHLGPDEEPNIPVFVATNTSFARSVVAEGNLEAAESTSITAPSEAHMPLKVAWLADDGSQVKKGDLVARFDATDFERQLADGETDRAVAARKREREQALLGASMRARDRTATLAELELEQTRRFQSKDEEIFSRHQIAESAIDEKLQAARVDHAKDAKGIEERVASSKLDGIRVESQVAQQSIEEAKQGLSNLEVSSPGTGLLVVKRDWRGNPVRVGDTVWPGRDIAEIPHTDKMQAKVYVLEADAGDLAVGQRAAIVIEAIPEVTFSAKVETIESLARPISDKSPVQYFEVVLALDGEASKAMKPGHRLRATITIGAEDALVVPRHCVFEVEGKPVVYKQVGETFEVAPVELGAGTPGRVVVTSGIEAGDRLATRDPTRAAGEPGQGDTPGTASNPQPTEASP